MRKYKEYYYNKKNPKCNEMELSSEGYPFYKDTKNLVHRYMAKKHLNDDKPLESWQEVHHADGDRRNYNPNNLVILSKEDHWKIENRLIKERNLNRVSKLLTSLALLCILLNKRVISFIILIISIFVWVYPNSIDLIMRKTKIYKVIHDEYDEKNLIAIDDEKEK